MHSIISVKANIPRGLDAAELQQQTSDYGLEGDHIPASVKHCNMLNFLQKRRFNSGNRKLYSFVAEVI